MEELLPVLAAWLEDGPDLATALKAALSGEVALLPLEEPPFEQTTYALEVHVLGATRTFLLLADPIGLAQNGRFPLQLRPYDDAQADLLRTLLEQTETQERTAEERLSTMPPPPDVLTEPPRRGGDPLVGKAIGGGKFEILELLGSGAAGRVYKARHRDLRKTVAVKVLHPFFQRDPQYATRFQGEALSASQLDHPNVMRVLDFGQEPDGMLYIVMEFLEGRDLQSVIDAEGPLPLERLVPIAMQICAGLGAAHERGIIHRDIKPENVVLVPGVDDEGKPIELAKVCDFGIAQMQAPIEGDDDDGPRSNLVCGTPEYMSPEQGKGQDLDARTDVYAVGITLYEMATKRVPFTAETPMAVLMRHFSEPPTPPSQLVPDLDPLLESIILKSIEKDRVARWSGARELRTELRTLLEPVLLEASRAQRRRELLDASRLAPLESPDSGFAEFFVSLSSAVLRTGYYDRGHPEFGTALARFMEAIDKTLKHRGELSFARRDVAQQVVFTVVTGVGEVRELKKLLPGTLHEMYAHKFGDVFVRRNVVSLTLRDGIDEGEVADFVELLSGPEIPAEELRKKFEARGFVYAQLLFLSDLLGARRKLPWQVDLCISRLARDLSTLPLMRGVDLEQMRVVRTQLIGDVLRPLGRADQVQLLLDNADLISSQTDHVPELAGVDVTEAIVDALALPACVALVHHLADVIEGKRAAPAMMGATGMSGTFALGGSGSLLPTSGPGGRGAAGRDPRELLRVAAVRLAREQGPEVEDALRSLYDRGVLKLDELPEQAQGWIQAEMRAQRLAADPEATLRAFDLTSDPDAYETEAAALEAVARALARRGDALNVRTVLARFAAHANDTTGLRVQRIMQRATAALRVLEEPEVAIGLARALMTAPTPQAREAAQGLLGRLGAAAADALARARAQITAADAAVRGRFVAAFHGLGAGTWPAISATLAPLVAAFTAGTPADAEVIEDLLRAAPDVEDAAGGELALPLLAHSSPGVRSAAAAALATLWGARARQPLLDVLDGSDDATRFGALAGLRKTGAIDVDVVVRIERILAASTAGDELRATAAAALTDVDPKARGSALVLLSRIVRTVPKTGLVDRLKGALASSGASGADGGAMVTVAAARSLLALGGSQGRKIVDERRGQSTGLLRQQLDALVGGA